MSQIGEIYRTKQGKGLDSPWEIIEITKDKIKFEVLLNSFPYRIKSSCLIEELDSNFLKLERTNALDNLSKSSRESYLEQLKRE
jgi:hypothetical protein